MKRIKLEHKNSKAVVEVDASQLQTMKYNGWRPVKKTAPAKSKTESEEKSNG